jgi:hypothetical protein
MAPRPCPAVSPQGLLSARRAPQEPTTSREVRATLVKVLLPFDLFLSISSVVSLGKDTDVALLGLSYTAG